MIKTRHAALLVGVSLCALASNGLAQNVGTTGAVNPLTQSTPPGGGTKQVTIGSQVIFKERFVTSAAGSLQLVFLDKSTLNIGPNSDVVINEYVYDPAKRDGKMSIGLAKGALRFVGGQISHNGNAEIKTPVATIGLRGAVATTSFNPQSQTQTTSSIVGSATVTGLAGGTVTMVQGYTTTVGQGQSPSQPTRTPPQVLATATGQTTSQSGQTGGSATPPSDTTANTQLSGDRSQSNVVLSTTQSTNQVAQQTGSTNQSVTDTRQSTQITSTTTAAAPIAQAALAPRALAYVVSGPGAGGPVPYLTAAFTANTNIAVSQLLGYRVGGADNLRSSETIRTLQVGFGINGRGANQASALLVLASPLRQSDEGLVSTGGFTATSRTTVTGVTIPLGPNIANGSSSSISGTTQLASDGSRLPANFSIDQNSLQVSTTGVVQRSSSSVAQFGSTLALPPNGTTPYTYSQIVSQVTPPAGLGSNRPELTLNGYVGGVLQTFVFPAGSTGAVPGQSLAVTGLNGDGRDVTLSFNPTNSDATAIVNIASRTSGSNLTNASLRFGAANGASRSTYIDTSTFGLRAAATIDASGNTTNTPGSFSSPSGSGNFTGGQLNLTSWSTIVGTVPGAAQALLQATDVTACACEFTQWGFWGGNVNRGDPSGSTSSDRGNLLTWVAGQLADRSLVPTTGSATYNGHIIGNVQFGTSIGTNYVAGGTFNHTVNFGSGTGNLAFTFDQRNYTGTSALNSANRANFNGSFATTGPVVSASGSLQGSFFGPNTGAGTAPLEQGGQFYLSGAPPAGGTGTYIGAGIFAARR